MTRAALIAKLNDIVNEKNSYDNGFHYEAVVSDWQNYGKDRTYFAYVETRDCSKHYVKVGYGYFDNISGNYVPKKYANLER